MGENMNNKLQLHVLKKSFLEYDPGGLILLLSGLNIFILELIIQMN